MSMHIEDLDTLTGVWERQTDRANEATNEAVKAAQDHAYALGRARGRAEAAALAAARARDTLIAEGATHEQLRAAIAGRVSDVGKPTAWADGLCAV